MADDLTVDDETFAAVREQLRAAWRRANPTAPEDAMPGAITASEPSATKLHDDWTPPKLAKADERVTYRAAAEGADETCYRCRYYQYGTCGLVEGGIEAAYVCDLYTVPLATAPASMFAIRDAGETPTLHVYQPATFAEPPEWSPFLPVPGIYDHPLHGTLDFRPETYDRIINNFKSGIYQEKLPVTVQHEQYSSAVGWITDLRLADTGAIEAKVEWNDRGRTLIDDDRYLYVSAEYAFIWSPPEAPETVYEDVALGLTLCTRPYFKERVLPPLAASEAVLTRHAGEPGKEVLMGEQKPTEQTPPAAKPEAVQLSEAEIREFRELKATHAAQATELATFKERAESAETRVGALETESRRKRFTDVVMGRAEGSDGARWFGEPEKHVAHLITLAETFGEDAAEVAHYIGVMTAHATQLKQSNLFREIGTGRGGDEPRTAWDKIEAKAAEFAEAKGVTHAKAVEHVISTDRELARQYAAERRPTISMEGE